MAEKVPGWVERLLIPAMESRVRSIVKEEVGHLEKVIDTRFDAMDEKFEARFETLDVKIDSLEKRFPAIQEMAEIKARLAQIEKNQT